MGKSQFSIAGNFHALLPLMAAGLSFSCASLEQDYVTDDSNAEYIVDIDVSTLKPYNANGAYADVLLDCIYPKPLGENCTFETLPVLMQESTDISVDDVMNRLVISKEHDWIATNFRDYLNDAPPYMLELFGSVTAVVIADRVKPSHADRGTGAIYINPLRYLWMTKKEKDSLYQAPIADRDTHMANALDALKFDDAWNYQYEGENSALPNEDADEYARRTNFRRKLSRVLYHELGHSREFYNPHTLNNVSSAMTPYSHSNVLLDNESVAYQQLDKLYPLKSAFLKEYVQFQQFGVEPSQALLGATAHYIGDEFAKDSASDVYSYRTSNKATGEKVHQVKAEDSAMLFEGVMMKLFLNHEARIGFIDTSDTTCKGKWIQYFDNRIAKPEVFERAQLVVNEFLPELEFSIEDLGEYDRFISDKICTPILPN